MTPRTPAEQPEHHAHTPDLDPARPPATRDELHAWLRAHLSLTIPRTPLTGGNTAPFDYLVHTFFEGRGGTAPSADGPRALPQLPPPSPADCVVWAHRGGGKTFLGAVATLLDLVFKPGIEVRILGGSMEQSKRMHAHLRRLFDPRARPALAALVDGKITDTRLRLRNGSVVELLAQSQTSVRGTRVQKLRCDEVDLFTRDVWEAAQLTTRSAQCGAWHVTGSVECLSTMHLTHGVMHELLTECKEGARTLFRWGVVDTLERCPDSHSCTPPQGADPSARPCPLLPECAGRAKLREPGDAGHTTIADAITLKRRVGRATWDAEMLCKRPKRTDAVLPEFNRALHVIDSLPFDPAAIEPPPLWLAGMDFGWRAPTVVLWALQDPLGTLYVVDEHAAPGVLLENHIQAIKRGVPHAAHAEDEDTRGGDPRPPRWPAPAWIGADPAGENSHEQTGTSNADTMRREGLTVRTRRLPLREGLNLIRARLAPADGSPPRLLVHARCTTLIQSLERYHFPPDDPASDTPVKRDGFDHAVDALRYLLQNLDRPFRTTTWRYA